MERTLLSIPVDVPDVDAVEAWYERPTGQGRPRPFAVLFAHGSNFGKDSPWTRTVVEGFLARGVAVLSFDYAYRTRLRRGAAAAVGRTDPLADLEHVHTRALAALAERSPTERMILAGKSLGARLSTLLAAKGERCHGLVSFGYPLPPRGPDRLLSEHFATLAQPALFLQGTRDPLCDVALLERELLRYSGAAQVEVLEDGDHGFFLPDEQDAEVPRSLDALVERSVAWLDTSWP